MKHNLNLNLEAAIRRMRIARLTGRISRKVQQRLMRRLTGATWEQNDIEARKAIRSRWQSMMALRAQVELENEPILLARRESELKAFQIHFCQPEEKIQGFIPVTAEDPTNSPEWWQAAGKRDRARETQEKRAIRAACKAAGVSSEDTKRLLHMLDRGDVLAKDLLAEFA